MGSRRRCAVVFLGPRSTSAPRPASLILGLRSSRLLNETIGVDNVRRRALPLEISREVGDQHGQSSPVVGEKTPPLSPGTSCHGNDTDSAQAQESALVALSGALRERTLSGVLLQRR